MLAALAALCGCEPPVGPARVLLDQDIPIKDLSSPRRVSVSDPATGYRLVEVDQSHVDVRITQFLDHQRLVFDTQSLRDAPERACGFTHGGTLELILSSKDKV